MKLGLSLAGYVLSIILANMLTAQFGLVPAGFGLVVTAGTYAAGFALLFRDFVQRYGRIRWALAAIAVGGILSALLASPAIALASTVAFLVAELVDLGVFTPLRRRVGFARAVIYSNLVSAPVDTVIFLWLAGFPVTWPAVLGQFLVKMVWATIIPLCIYTTVRHRAVLR
jgi:hypothetical protein